MSDALVSEVLKEVVSPVVATAVSAFLGEKAVTGVEHDNKAQRNKVYSVRAGALLIGVAVFLIFWLGNRSAAPPIAALQSVIAKPNLAKKGDRVTVTVELDRAAPANGASIVLTSSDPAILTVDGNAVVAPGATIGTGYCEIADVPTYPAPVAIIATYLGSRVQTEVNVAKSAPVKSIQTGAHETSTPHATQTHSLTQAIPQPKTAVQGPSKPAPLNPELLARWVEAQGQLSAEKSYWENVKQHMPAGTSLRPEITSQIVAADSAGRRCDAAEKTFDAASLSSCVDAVNDHLTQLKIQR